MCVCFPIGHKLSHACTHTNSQSMILKHVCTQTQKVILSHTRKSHPKKKLSQIDSGTPDWIRVYEAIKQTCSRFFFLAHLQQTVQQNRACRKATVRPSTRISAFHSQWHMSQTFICFLSIPLKTRKEADSKQKLTGQCEEELFKTNFKGHEHAPSNHEHGFDSQK